MVDNMSKREEASYLAEAAAELVYRMAIVSTANKGEGKTEEECEEFFHGTVREVEERFEDFIGKDLMEKVFDKKVKHEVQQRLISAWVKNEMKSTDSPDVK